MFKKNILPSIGECVMIKVKEINLTDSYSIVDIIEYNKKGLLILSEVSNRRIKSIKKELPIDKLDVAIVLKVDTDKELIDLSKKRLSYDEIQKCKDEFYKRKKILNIVDQEFVNNYIIPFENINGPIIDCLNKKELFIDEKMSNFYELYHKTQKQTEKISAIISITSYKENGISFIKNALKDGQKSSNDIEILLISSPEYSISHVSSNTQDSIDKINNCISIIINSIGTNGSVKIINNPSINYIQRLDLSDN